MDKLYYVTAKQSMPPANPDKVRIVSDFYRTEQSAKLKLKQLAHKHNRDNLFFTVGWVWKSEQNNSN
jgi:hypothetical protein